MKLIFGDPASIALRDRAKVKRGKTVHMHAKYGTAEGQVCGDCVHLIRQKPGNHTFLKCSKYSTGHSAASDWRKKWAACGLFARSP